MKKILFSLVALVASMSMNAQIMKVMKGNEVVATYTSVQADNVVFEEEIVETWNYIGVGEWVETLPELFGEEAMTLNVNVYESVENPGKYKFNGLGLPMANWFYEQDMTDYVNEYWYDAYLTIDATDPDNVIMPVQEMGFNAGSSYGWPTIGNYVNDQLVAPGTLKDGVITFAIKGMVCGMGTSYYYYNGSGLCQLTLPTDDAKIVAKKNLSTNKQMKMGSFQEYKTNSVR
ncbi:MAG: hypothetical protein KBT20_02225 [Bacteroidales bacterium]|nr:hypothetical protein [Candidatus Liminaster caballi]